MLITLIFSMKNGKFFDGPPLLEKFSKIFFHRENFFSGAGLS